MNGKCIRHISIRKAREHAFLLCCQLAYSYHHHQHHHRGHLQHHLTQQPAINNRKKTGNESRRSGTENTDKSKHQQHHNISERGDILESFSSRFSYTSGEGLQSFFSSLSYITSLCYLRRSSHGLPVLPTTGFGFPLSFFLGAGKAIVSRRVVQFLLFRFLFFPFPFPIFGFPDWRFTSRDQ